ncbi:MAG: RICIN domain-containing protein [Clostridia bacterium]|nr:RICIN domain-containing protein [Clostridia bacterium]
MRKLVSLFLVFILAVPAFASNDVTYRDIKIIFNNETVVPYDEQGNEVEPFIYDDRTYLPLRAIGSLLDKTVAWDNDTRSAIIGQPPTEPELAQTVANIYVDGQLLTPQNEPLNISGSLFLPVREISEAFDLVVSWDDANSAVIITSETFADKFYQLSLAGTDNCLAIKDSLPDAGTRLALAPRSDSKELSWRFRKYASNFYSLINEQTLLAADVNSASTLPEAEIIQWTPSGASNQQWRFEKNQDGSYGIISKLSGLYLTEVNGAIIQDEKAEGKNQSWEITYLGDYSSIISQVMETEAYKSLSAVVRERFEAYILGDAPYCITVYDKAEALLNEQEFMRLDMEAQTELLYQCMETPPVDLLSGSMATMLEAEIEINSVEKKENQAIWGEQDIDAYYYDVSIDGEKLTVVIGGSEDEEYVIRIAQSVACFEKPIRRTLHTFYYSDVDAGSWNGGGGQIWNNTKYKGDVNNMVQMFAHELGHVLDNGSIGSNSIWTRAQSADMVPVSGYGNTNRWEDLAEFSRLYLLARGDREREAQIESVYPNRMAAYKALLYHTDSEYYSEYKTYYDKAVAPVAQTPEIDFSKYALLLGDQGFLGIDNDEIVHSGVPYEWQIVQEGDAVSIISKTGYPLFVSSRRYNASISIDTQEKQSTAFFLRKEGSSYELINDVTGFSVGKYSIQSTQSIPGVGYFTISQDDGKALAVTEDRAGARVVLAEADGSDFQTWFIAKFDGNNAYIMNKATGKFLDVSGENMEKDGVIIVWNQTKAPNQTWIVEEVGAKTTITAAHSQLKLGVYNGEVFQGYEQAWTLSEIE